MQRMGNVMSLPDFIPVHPHWFSVLLSSLTALIGLGAGVCFSMSDGSEFSDFLNPVGVLLLLLSFLAIGLVACLIFIIIAGPTFWLYNYLRWPCYAAILVGLPSGLFCAFGSVFALETYGSRKSAAKSEAQD